MNSIEEAVRTPLYKGAFTKDQVYVVSDCSTNNTKMLMTHSVDNYVFLYEALMLGNSNGNVISCYLIGEYQTRKLLVTNTTFDLKVKLVDPLEGVLEFIPSTHDSLEKAKEKTTRCIELITRNKQHNYNAIKHVFNKFTEFVNATYGASK